MKKKKALINYIIFMPKFTYQEYVNQFLLCLLPMNASSKFANNICILWIQMHEQLNKDISDCITAIIRKIINNKEYFIEFVLLYTCNAWLIKLTSMFYCQQYAS